MINHLNEMLNRSRRNDISGVDRTLFTELTPETLKIAEETTEAIGQLSEDEWYVLAVHLKLLNKTINRRKSYDYSSYRRSFRKGQNVAKGVEQAGGRAVVVPGMGADMRLGDVMQQEKAGFRHFFLWKWCAGALTAATKYGYRKTWHAINRRRVTAINDGKTVLDLVLWIRKNLVNE